MKYSIAPNGIRLQYNADRPPSHLEIIKLGHAQLCFYRDDGRDPSHELLEDIEAYALIMESADPDQNAQSYFRIKGSDKSLRPHEIVRMIGLKRGGFLQ